MADRALSYGTFGSLKKSDKAVSVNVLKEEHVAKAADRVTGEEMRMHEQNIAKSDVLRARMPWWAR